MNQEFVTYDQALALKELGFGEPCLLSLNWINGYNTYTEKSNEPKAWISSNVEIKYDFSQFKVDFKDVYHVEIQIPLYQQAFRWFRDKHGLYIHFVPEFYMTGINFNWQILWYLPKEKWTEYVVCNGTMLFGDNGEYPTQEDAENACLDKLIEIVKNKNE
jgi:hypothetical protein